MSTIRQQIIDLLQHEQMNARDLSQTLSIMEKEVYPHLEQAISLLDAILNAQ